MSIGNEPVTEPKRILVVEDEERVANLIQRQLETDGFEVQIAVRGSTALNLVATHPPDLVILDLRLPDVSGYELCAMLRRLYSAQQLPIVILTGVEQTAMELREQAVGANAYLRKPYDAIELLETVNRLLASS